MSDFEKFKGELLSKEMFYSSSKGKTLGTKNMNNFLRSGTNLKEKR